MRQDFDMDHYERQQANFKELAQQEGFIGHDDEIEVHDHVSQATIVYTETSTNKIVDFLEDSDNPLVLSQDPVLIKKKSSEVNVLIGVYAIGLELNPGPTIADADISDLDRITEVMSDAQISATKDNNKKRWRLLGSNIIMSRAGLNISNTVAVVLTRGAVQRGNAMQAFPSIRLIRPGEVHKESIEYNGSLWAGTPTVGASFKVKRVARLFVARR